jgi:REP element-mobilizing transposase RayT
MKHPATLRFTRRTLPHWLVADASYFVTLRLAGTLPKSLVEELLRERDAVAESEDARHELARRQFARIEGLLDGGDSERMDLANPEVAQMCLANLDWLRARGWRVFAATVLGNHAHLLLRSGNGRSAELLTDIDLYKSFTAREANRILGRQGRFWARDQFDHWLRDAAKFDGVVRYIARNPVKAGLATDWRDWPWTFVEEALRRACDG